MGQLLVSKGGDMCRFLVILFLLTNPVFADQVSIDTTGWSQDAKNDVTAMAVKLLFNNGISYSSISVNLPVIDVGNPTSNISGVLTTQNILDAHIAEQSLRDAALAVVLADEQAKQTEITNSEFKNLTLSQIDSYIDVQVNAINNLTDAKNFLKVFLKKLIKYLKARGI